MNREQLWSFDWSTDMRKYYVFLFLVDSIVCLFYFIFFCRFSSVFFMTVELKLHPGGRRISFWRTLVPPRRWCVAIRSVGSSSQSRPYGNVFPKPASRRTNPKGIPNANEISGSVCDRYQVNSLACSTMSFSCMTATPTSLSSRAKQ